MIGSFIFLALWGASASPTARASLATFELSLGQAESQALHHSNRVQSFSSDYDSAVNQADAQFQSLLPKLSFQGNYTYYASIPNVQFFGGSSIPFGTNNTYAIGPVLNYTLWDSFSGKKAYDSAKALAESRNEDRKNSELQLLLSLRQAYVQVQLGIDELSLINDSLDLAKAQDRDVMSRFNAGAATRLDVVTSQRSVLSYEIQFEQRQADLSSSFKDLINLLGTHPDVDTSHPGPVGVPGVSLSLKLDSLRDLITDVSSGTFEAPGLDQPQIKSQTLQSESLKLSADSQTAKFFPTIQISGGITEILPDVPNPPSYLQKSVGVTLTLPLYLGDPTRHLVDQQKNASIAAEYRAKQLSDDISRDYSKAQEMLASLKYQRDLAARDVSQSEEEAKLYYTSYKAGKINFIDVQNANVQALQAKVNAARIDAQILNQLVTLKYLSGKELPHG